MISGMKLWPLVLVLGTVVQALGLALFSSVSMTRWSQIGQPLALAVTLLGVVAVVWFTFRNRNKPGMIISTGLVLGAGYLAAFHLVGIAIFPGLLRDIDAPGYWISLLRVFVVAACIHIAVAAAVFGAMRIGWLGAGRVL